MPDFEPIFSGRFLKNEIFEPTCVADYSYGIKPDDIDGNNHTNNTVYAKMAEVILKRDGRKIKFFQINFLKETKLGDRVDIYTKQKQPNDDSKSIDILGKLCEGYSSFLVHVETE